MCLCFRIVLFLTARSYREPTTIAKRLICNDSVSNGPCDRDYAIIIRPLRPLPLRLPIRRGNLREGGREKNVLATPDVPCPVPRSSSARAGHRPLATSSWLLCCTDDPTRFTQLYRFLLTSDSSLSFRPHIHVELSFFQLLPRTKHPAILHGKNP